MELIPTWKKKFYEKKQIIKFAVRGKCGAVTCTKEVIKKKNSVNNKEEIAAKYHGGYRRSRFPYQILL